MCCIPAPDLGHRQATHSTPWGPQQRRPDGQVWCTSDAEQPADDGWQSGGVLLIAPSCGRGELQLLLQTRVGELNSLHMSINAKKIRIGPRCDYGLCQYNHIKLTFSSLDQ